VGFFAQKAINPAGNNGWLFGNFSLLGTQALGVGAVLLYSVVVTFVLLKILDYAMGLRVGEIEEVMGLDNTQHKESAYTLLD
jgi:Amt family ammonium transporter